MAQVAASGFPAILECRLFQKSTAEAGVCVVRTQYSTAVLPKTSTLTITQDAFTGTFGDMRVSQTPRVHRDKVYWTLEDSRWKLREYHFSDNYNHRDELGRLDSDGQKTITELWALIAGITGLSITVGTVPSYNPPAAWAGKSAFEAAEQLLDDTSCVMVYDPVAATYRISIAGTGALPDLARRTYTPGPDLAVKDLHIDSAPILYESDLDAEAVMIDAAGDLVALGGLVTPIDFFTGFDGEAAADRSRYQQSAFRLWRVTQAGYPEILDASKLILFDSRATEIAQGRDGLSVSAHAASDSSNGFATFPEYQFLRTSSENDGDETLTLLPGSNVFHSNSPIISVTSAGAIQEDIKIHTSFHVRDDDGTLRRDRVTRTINAGGTDVTVIVPWLKPVLSDLPDKNTGASQWSSLHSSVADAMETRYSSLRQTAVIPTLLSASGSGQVGAVLYEMNVGWRGNLRTTWAFNFIPSHWRSLRA